MIYIYYEGRHGNFIFEYIFAKYISFLTGQLINDEIKYYTYTNSKFIQFIDKENINNTISTKDDNNDFLITDKNASDIIEKLIQNKEFLDGKNIILGKRTGYYQNSILYKHHTNFIPSIIKYPQLNSNIYGDKTVVLHIRLDDFHRNGHDSEILYFNYYDNIINKFQYTDIHIVYNKPENSSYKKRVLQKIGKTYSDEESNYLKYFEKKYNAKMVSADISSDFYYFGKFKHIILSASSFAFWATVNIPHNCVVHIPTHKQCNATSNTSNILKWCGHEVFEYPNLKFVNFNETLKIIGHCFPSCEGYVGEINYPIKLTTLYPAHFDCTIAGFFSNCSLALYNIVKYYNLTKSMPDNIDMSLLFELYKKYSLDYSTSTRSLCKLLSIDDCICTICNPDLSDDKWKYRYSRCCNKTISYETNIGPRYFNDYMKPNESILKQSSFKHWSQFHPYTNELIDCVKPFALSTFSPSQHILNLVKEYENKYQINYDNTCVLFFRGGDKAREYKLPTYQEYIIEIRKNHEGAYLKYLIQSDESEFITEMMNKFTRSFYFKDEIRTLPRSRKGQVDKCITDVSNFEFTQKFLAIIIIMSKCKFVYCNSGNISLWIRIYRELNEGFNQWIFFNNERVWFKQNQ